MTERTPVDVELLWDEFHELVNMTSDEIRIWLLADAAGEGGLLPPEPGLDMEPPELGGRVVDLLRKRKADLTVEDTDVMRRVVEFVEDRLDDPPSGDEREETWRRSLMSVGHDPLKPT